MIKAVKNFGVLATNLDVLNNYFDNLLKLFSDLYLAKLLDTSAKSFFPCGNVKFARFRGISCSSL